MSRPVMEMDRWTDVITGRSGREKRTREVVAYHLGRLILHLGELVDACDHVSDQLVFRESQAAPVGDVNPVHHLGVLAGGTAGLDQTM